MKREGSEKNAFVGRIGTFTGNRTTPNATRMIAIETFLVETILENFERCSRRYIFIECNKRKTLPKLYGER